MQTTSHIRRCLILDRQGDLAQALTPWLEGQGLRPTPGPSGLPATPDVELPHVEVLIVRVGPDQDALCRRILAPVFARNGAAVVVAADRPDDEALAWYVHMGAAAYAGMPMTPQKIASITRALERQLQHLTPNADGYRVRAERAHWVEITADSRSEYVTRFSEFVERLAVTSLPESDLRHLVVAVQEMGQNAVEWGNTYDENKKVHLSYCILSDEIVIKIEDEGEGFDPAGVPDPTLDPEAHFEQRLAAGKRPGGYGLCLVREFMDEVLYNDKGNILIMRKRLAPTPRAVLEGVPAPMAEGLS